MTGTSGLQWTHKSFRSFCPNCTARANKLEPVLCTLATLCFAKRIWEIDDATNDFTHVKGLQAEAAKAARMEDESLDPLGSGSDGKPSYLPCDAYYNLSFSKVLRMLERLRANGFVSFAEA